MARNKEFDEAVVLKKAMEVFWKQGYEKTSMQDLVDHMGIHRRSIYDTFGNKHSLFLSALAEYESMVSDSLSKTINHTQTTKQAVRAIFNTVINTAESTDSPVGCLAVNTATELASIDLDIKQIITKMFKSTEQMFKDILEEGIEKGELSPSLNAQVTAQYLHTNLVGFRVLVKTDYTKEELEEILNLVLKVLD